MFGAFLVMLGVTMSGGGLWLISLGGTSYYFIFGTLLIICGYLACLDRESATFVYLSALLFTTAWAVSEVGLHGWLLLPRLDLPIALGLVFVLHATRNKRWRLKWFVAGVRIGARVLQRRRVAFVPGLSATAFLVITAIDIEAPGQHVPTAPVAAGHQISESSAGDWPHYGNSHAGRRYSSLAQVNRENVASLKVAWTYRTGEDPEDDDEDDPAVTFEVTPIKIRDALYLCSPRGVVIALDPETGKERWRHDPHAQIERNRISQGNRARNSATTGPSTWPAGWAWSSPATTW
jgi:glucose dehydrogenase